MSVTSIEWTATRLPDGRVLPGYTFNPWQGCVKVSEACRNCYAATLGHRFGVEWGPTARRKFQGGSYWQEPLAWNRAAEKAGIRRKVFCASMADVFERLPEAHPDADAMEDARARLWGLIEETPALDWLLLTKRPENVTVPVPGRWLERGAWPRNCWVGTTVEDQESADKRIPWLLKVPAPVRFLSCEPLIGPVDLWSISLPLGARYNALEGCGHNPHGNCQSTPNTWGRRVDWVIAGGESGPKARPSHPGWYRLLRDQCTTAGVPFFFKQFGEWLPTDQPHLEDAVQASGKSRIDFHPVVLAGEEDPAQRDGRRTRVYFMHVGKKAAGRTLDGRTWDEMPEAPRA